MGELGHPLPLSPPPALEALPVSPERASGKRGRFCLSSASWKEAEAPGGRIGEEARSQGLSRTSHTQRHPGSRECRP